jgi:hypothetical protein
MEEPPVHRRVNHENPTKILDSNLSSEMESMSDSDMNSSSRNNSNRNPDLKPPHEMSDEEFDMKGTSRKEYENEYYKFVCSEIIDDFLYLGSDLVA